MESKDTVMSAQQVQKILDKWNDIDSREMASGTNARPGILDLIADIVVAQAEISFKVGIKEVVEWVGTHKFGNECDSIFYIAVKEWQPKLKEWGIYGTDS